MNGEAVVAVSGVSKTFSRDNVSVEALSNIDIDVRKGEVVSVVGPSGCGKTTLLRLFAGLVKPTVGEVRVNGLSPEDNVRRNGIGFVFQKPLLFPWRTVVRNVLLPSELAKANVDRSPPESAKRLLGTLGLEGFEDVYPGQLSGGMLQRAALARALMTEPTLLLLDEPFSALDETTREQIWTDFSGFWRSQGLTVILVTHSIREAVFLSDRVLVMSKRPGRILSETCVDFPGTREHRIAASLEFIQLCEKVRARLQ